MSQPCSITTCKKASRALCYCCQQSLCLIHLKEHNDLLLLQLNPLVDQINNIGDRLKAINIENKTGDYRQILEQWRIDCHKKIDDFFEQKCQKINRHVTEKVRKQREDIGQIQSKIATLLREEEVSRQDIDLLTATIRNLEQEVNEIECSSFNIKIRPILIDDSLIDIEESKINRFDLSKLPPVYKTINYKDGSFVALTSNERYLLIHQAPNLCLIDRELTIVRQAAYNHTELRAMCWSSSLDQFVITSESGVYSIDEKTITTKNLQIDQARAWCSCTCSDTSLFLSTYEFASSIVEYRLLPTIQFVREWKSPHTCQKEAWITDMKYINGSIALVIKNPSQKKIFLELRNIKTLGRLWAYQLDNMDLQKRSFHCCLLDGEEWLVLDHESDRLVHITKDGKMKSCCAYKSGPWGATIFGSTIIAIQIDDGVNFHKF